MAYHIVIRPRSAEGASKQYFFVIAPPKNNIDNGLAPAYQLENEFLFRPGLIFGCKFLSSCSSRFTDGRGLSFECNGA